MKMYGVAILAGCFFAGHIIGDQLGKAFHLNANLGGVGYAMIFLSSSMFLMQITANKDRMKAGGIMINYDFNGKA